MITAIAARTIAVVVTLCGSLAGAAEPLRSGPAIGERPKPFAVIAVTGPQRGKTHCYVCEAEARPIVIVFARSITPPLGALVKHLDTALATHRAAELRSWVVFLTDSRGTLEASIDQLAQQHAIGALPLTLVEGSDGPPSYRIGRDADLTVILAVKQKVVATHAFRAGEFTEVKLAEVLADLPKIVEAR